MGGSWPVAVFSDLVRREPRDASPAREISVQKYATEYIMVGMLRCLISSSCEFCLDTSRPSPSRWDRPNRVLLNARRPSPSVPLAVLDFECVESVYRDISAACCSNHNRCGRRLSHDIDPARIAADADSKKTTLDFHEPLKPVGQILCPHSADDSHHPIP